MKIVHVVSSFSPGGAEVLVKDIAIHTDKNYNVEIWAVGATGDNNFEKRYVEELKKNNVGYVNVGKVAHKNRMWVVWRLRKLIKEKKPAVINTHSELATFYCAPAKIGLKVKLVQTIHNTVIAYPLLQKYLSRPFVSKYVAISEKCRELIKDVIRVGDKKIELIYNGINLGKFQHKERRIKQEVKNIVCIGRLDVQKDHATLLKSFSILKFKLAEVGKSIPKLNLIGIGVLQKELEILALELGLNNYVVFWGARNDVPDLLFENDIWVMSSRWEGLSIAMLEAFSSGIPVVATNVGSNSEVIEDDVSGILVEKENPAQLSQVLFSLIQDYSKRVALSRNAQRRAKLFNIESCVSNYLKLYNSFFDLKTNELSYDSVSAS